jgi:heptose I phosphotransferase
MENDEHIQLLDHGRLRVAAEFLPLFQANGLETFARVMALAGGRMMRSVPGRSTVRLELRRPEGGTRVVFLKRYEPQYLSFGRKLLRLLGWPGAGDEALHEWNALRRLRVCGFNTAAPIAVGQLRTGGVVTRSFLMTAEIAGGVAAHDYLRTLNAGQRRSLVRRIAGWTARFHGAGFVHKDFYLSHLFVVPSAGTADPELFCIDLQRLVRPRFLRERWRIKDLAQLGYTAQLAGATRGDLLCFYRTCFQRDRLTAGDKRFIRRVLARIQRLHGRRPKFDVIWDQPGVHPPNV